MFDFEATYNELAEKKREREESAALDWLNLWIAARPGEPVEITHAAKHATVLKAMMLRAAQLALDGVNEKLSRPGGRG